MTTAAQHAARRRTPATTATSLYRPAHTPFGWTWSVPGDAGVARTEAEARACIARRLPTPATPRKGTRP